MKNRIITRCLALFVLIFLISVASPHGSKANQPPYTLVNLTPTWTTGIISDNVGRAGLSVEDLNQDGMNEIASCSDDYAYTLNYAAATYDTTWYSSEVQCRRITVSDREPDGMKELFIATADGKVLLIHGASYEEIGRFSLPAGMIADGIAVGDVDNDGISEIVLATTSSTLVYDAFTYSLEWNASGYGGSEVAIDNIDNDPVMEIVVNNTPAHVLNAADKIQEWAYAGGFGYRMGVGDVDGDGKGEIAYIEGWENAYVLEGDSHTIKWHLGNLGDLDSISVADADGDGISEVITGDGQWGDIKGYRGIDGLHLWSIQNPEHGVSGISVGDTDNDGAREIIWGGGLTSSGKDALFVGNWGTQSIEWESEDLDGPFYVAAGDIDLDGQNELVMATRSSISHYDGGTIKVYDGTTYQVEWSMMVSNSYFDLYQLAIGQLDSDPALEIIVGGDNWYDTRLLTYDGISHAVEWLSPVLAGGPPRGMLLNDLDADSVDEIIVALSDQHVLVFHGSSNVIQWDSGTLNGDIQDIAIGDADGNAVDDIGIVTTQAVYLYEAGTWSQKLFRPFTNGIRLVITEADLFSSGSVVLQVSGAGFSELQAWSGPGFPLTWRQNLGEVQLNDLAAHDLDGDGYQELVLMGSSGPSGSQKGMLWIGTKSYPLFWEYKNRTDWGSISSMALSDLDNDGEDDFLFGGSHLIQVDEISSTSGNAYLSNLPMISQACVPIFYDDFSNPGSGWPRSDNGSVLYEYKNQEYRILVRPDWYGAGASPGIHASDYNIGVDVRNQAGTTGSYGLIFGLSSDWSSFYTFEVFHDGWYGIYKYNPSTYNVLAEAYSPYINPGTAVNHIKVERNGGSIKAYANGHLLSSLIDYTYTGDRYVGLIVWSYDQPNVDIRFDNFLVDRLACAGLKTTSEPGGWLISPEDRFIDIDLQSKFDTTIP